MKIYSLKNSDWQLILFLLILNSMENTRTTFTLDFKIVAASMSIHCGRVCDVARELNIITSNLQHWKKLYQEGRFTIKKTSSEISHKNELQNLRKLIKELEMERHILKKAQNIFSRSGG
ncbi:transposase [Flavobacterium sp. S87F.05.LMB.W.Kidney.N]|uniref:transposase n=1 Tax=Flavobacterium sp. S87F.05.LMB.W.Kidney.N TaxID=1278758 RepID=UPI001FBBC77C|nr:transposase [Flavobacterium sp. S87F.05.LMB.W.Kidney.N]